MGCLDRRFWTESACSLNERDSNHEEKINFGLSVTGKVAAALTLAFWAVEAAMAAGIVAGGSSARSRR